MKGPRNFLAGLVAGFGILCVCTTILSSALDATDVEGERLGTTVATMTGSCASVTSDIHARSLDSGVASRNAGMGAGTAVLTGAWWYTEPNCEGFALPFAPGAAVIACLMVPASSIELLGFICINC